MITSLTVCDTGPRPMPTACTSSFMRCERGATVGYSDPYVHAINSDGIEMKASPVTAAADADCVVIVTDHKGFDYPGLVKSSKLIVDTRNALKGIASEKIVRL